LHVEINNLKQDLAALQSVDLSQFEPESYYFDETGGKTSSLTIGT
jgi:phage regulator Rha-like protein